MHVTIRLFARLREMAGAAEVRRKLPDGSSVRTAWDSLVGEFPDFDDYTKAVSCAVNEEYARMTTTLSEGDEVAFLPPVSGGSGELVSKRLRTAWRTSARVSPRERSEPAKRLAREGVGSSRGEAPRNDRDKCSTN
jgi:molybdopterin converting factor subunit 1